MFVASGGSSDAISASVQRATSRPARPPSTASTHDSVSSCAEQLAAARAERQPDRHLGRAAGAAREQQVGDVRAGDQQHDAGDASSRSSGGFGFAVHELCPRWPRLDAERLSP